MKKYKWSAIKTHKKQYMYHMLHIRLYRFFAEQPDMDQMVSNFQKKGKKYEKGFLIAQTIKKYNVPKIIIVKK